MDFFQCQANYGAKVPSPSPSLWYTLQTPQDLSILKSSANLDLSGSPFISSPDRRARPSYGRNFPQKNENFPRAEKRLELKLEHSYDEGDFSAVTHEAFANPNITSNFQKSQTVNFSHLHRSQVRFTNQELNEAVHIPRETKNHAPFNPPVSDQEFPRIRENNFETVWSCLHKGPVQPTHDVSFDQDTSSMSNYTADSLFELSSSFTQETDPLPNMNVGHSHEEYGHCAPENNQSHEVCIRVEDLRNSPILLNSVSTNTEPCKNLESKKPAVKKEKKMKSQSLQDVTNFSFLACNMETTKGEKPKRLKTTFEITPNPQVTTEKDSKARAHRCLICDKVFKRPSSYRIHYTIHSGEKQFSCSKCGKAFNVKSNLTRHEKLHGRPGGPKMGHTQKGAGRQKRYVY